MSHISKITSTENVTLVTFDSVPANISFLEKIFCAFADRGINVDMISKATPTREYASLSFTTGDNQLTEVLAMTNEIRSRYPTLKPIVSSSNVKLSLYGEDFPKYTGMAAQVFQVLASKGIELLLITTSDVDISLLVSSADHYKAEAALKELVLS
mgnify:CR=1 FL=1